jgi:hypothetical protein
MRKLNLVLGVRMPDKDTIVMGGRSFKAVEEAPVPEVPQAPVEQTSPVDPGVAGETPVSGDQGNPNPDPQV